MVWVGGFGFGSAKLGLGGFGFWLILWVGGLLMHAMMVV